jgi:catalase (peroxidase I)
MSGRKTGKCPFNVAHSVPVATRQRSPEYVKAALMLDWDAVYQDIVTLLKSNRADIYPPDDMLNNLTSYGPFFIRQAWHCAGELESFASFFGGGLMIFFFFFFPGS